MILKHFGHCAGDIFGMNEKYFLNKVKNIF